jgi:hypothetical protein
MVAEFVLVNQQLLILNRSRRRAPNLRASDRFVARLCALFIQSACLIRSAIYNATGKWVLDYPTTPDKVPKALGKI